jgi:hypothetical protein
MTALYEAILLEAWRMRLREYDTGERVVMDPLSDPLVAEGLRIKMGLPVPSENPLAELVREMGYRLA